MENAFFFSNMGAKLFAFSHIPEHPNGRGIIFCHPYSEEKQLSYRVFARFARELCREGFSVVRFDCRGYGDSHGDFADATIETMLCDTLRGVELLRETGCERIGLLGLRLGGAIAALAAEKDPGIDRLVLWSPVVSGSAYLDELFRRKTFSVLAAKKTIVTREQLIEQIGLADKVEVDGYYLTKEVYNRLLALDLAALVSNYKGSVLITSSVNERPWKYEDLSESYRKNGAACEWKVFEDKAFWNEQSMQEWSFPSEVYRGTLDWMIGNEKR